MSVATMSRYTKRAYLRLFSSTDENLKILIFPNSSDVDTLDHSTFVWQMYLPVPDSGYVGINM